MCNKIFTKTKEIFNQAQMMAPSLVFIDELEKFVGDNVGTETVINTLIQLLQGGITYRGVMFVGM